MVVDDNPSNIVFLATLLRQHGHCVEELQDGADVLGVVERVQPELIITDVMMPEMDGYELLSKLRENPLTRRIPCVFYTAHYGARVKALAAGAAWFLTNAEPSAHILDVVRRALAGETEGRETANAPR